MSDGGGVKTLPVMFLGREHKKPRSELFYVSVHYIFSFESFKIHIVYTFSFFFILKLKVLV